MQAVDALRHRFGDALVIVDHWKGDLAASASRERTSWPGILACRRVSPAESLKFDIGPLRKHRAAVSFLRLPGSRPARMNKIHVFFEVFEFGQDPQVVTDLLQIEPSKAWAKGEPVQGSKRGIRTHSRWVLESPLERSETVEEQLAALLPLLEARAAEVAEVSRRFEAGLMCACYFYETNPGFHLDSALLQRVSALGLDFDFDLYCLGSVSD